MQALQTFNFEELPVRTLEVDGEPYFIGKDVADILGYANGRDALSKHVDEDDKSSNVAKYDFRKFTKSRTYCSQRIGFIQPNLLIKTRISQTIQTLGNIRCPTSHSQTWYLRNGQRN